MARRTLNLIRSDRPGSVTSMMPTYYLKDEGELLYTTLIGMVMAAIFATGFHKDVDETLTSMAPEGTAYPFPAHTREPAAIFASAVTGFILGVTIWTIAGQIRWAMRLDLQPSIYYNEDLGFGTENTDTQSPFAVCVSTRITAIAAPDARKFLQNSAFNRLLQNVRPLVSEEEFQSIKEDLDKFQNEEGKIFHAALVEKYNKEENWVADIWDRYAYLSGRDPIAVSLNVSSDTAIHKSDLSYCDDVKPEGRAAALVYQYLQLNEEIKNATLNPLLVQEIVPMCMDRYKYVLSCTRIPGDVIDELKRYKNSKHIIVIRKGIMYKLDVYALTMYCEETLLTPEELQTQFELIYKETKHIKQAVQNPAVFTGQNRTTWAKDRSSLMESPLNSASLEDVESAILHIVLEDTSPENLNEEGFSTLTSNGYNRWFDKSLTVVVYENSRSGTNMEHTTADGTLFSRMLEYTWSNCQYDAVGNAISSGLDRHFGIVPPKKLKWNLTEFQSVIPVYEQNLANLCNDVDVCAKLLTHGKGAIKKCRVSPDGLIQMAFQLAYYRRYKKTPKTYESASTRFFKHGRTETIRPTSMDSKAFTKAMDDPHKSNQEKVKLLKKAILYQHHYKLEATNGMACDRHFFGLYMASKMAGVQSKLFTHKVLFEPDILSTSQCPWFYDKKLAEKSNIYPSGGNFGPQRKDGYGVYYMLLGENCISLHVTSCRSCPDTSSTEFANEIETAILDMQKLLKTK